MEEEKPREDEEEEEEEAEEQSLLVLLSEEEEEGRQDCQECEGYFEGSCTRTVSFYSPDLVVLGLSRTLARQWLVSWAHVTLRGATDSLVGDEGGVRVLLETILRAVVNTHPGERV